MADLNTTLNSSITAINNAVSTVNSINTSFNAFTTTIQNEVLSLAPLNDPQFINSINVSGDLRLTAPSTTSNSKILFEDVSGNVLSKIYNDKNGTLII